MKMAGCRSSRAAFGRKGFIGSLDLILSMLLFLAVIYMSIWANGEVRRSVSSFESSQAYKDKALVLCDVLLKTGGSPYHWETLNLSNSSVVNSTLLSIGLASEPNVLNLEKLDAFDGLPYTTTRKILGLGKEDYRVEILNERGRRIYSAGAVAQEVSSSIERLALLDGEIVVFKLSLY